MADRFGNPDLQTALATFVSGAKEYGIAQSLYQANEQVQQIKASAMKDAEKRAALNGLANSMVMQMAGQGADAAKIQQVFGAIKPVLPATPDQAIMLGVLNDDQEMLTRGRKAQQIQIEDTLRLEDAKTARALKLEMMKERAKGAQARKAGEVAFEVNTKVLDRSLNDLSKLIDQVGAYESTSSFSPLSNKAAAGRMKQLIYEAAIAYAKAVDPDSVAREGEVKAAQEALSFGLTTSNEAAKSAIANMRASMEERVRDRMKAAQGASPSKLNLNSYFE